MMKKLMLLLLLAILSRAQAYNCYPINQTASQNNDSSSLLYPLDNNGLSGRFTGYWSNTTNTTVMEERVITFQLWFLTYDKSHFFLSLVAIRNPSRLWDLVKPFIIWTANRNDLVSENATLEFGMDGDLKLQDNGRTVWSTNTTGKNVTHLCVSNLGNILLKNSTKDIVWRSQDFPSDIFSIQVGIKPGVRIVSWSSDKNTSSGPYSLAMEEKGLVLYRNLEPYWSFESNTSEAFAVFCWQPGGLISLDIQTNTSMLDAENFISGNSCRDSRPLRRRELQIANTYGIFVKLTSDGDVIIYAWNESSVNWYQVVKLSANVSCFLPSQCGSYGICSKADGNCIKECPKTFEYVNQGGRAVCNSTRPALLDSCQSSELIPMPGVDYFSSNFSLSLFAAMSENECSAGCESNCSCKAAFFKPGSCFYTYEDVQSLKTGNYTAFLKVATVPEPARIPKKQKRSMFLTVALSVLVPLLVVLSSMMACKMRVQKSPQNDSDAERDEEELEMSLRESMLTRFTYKQLEQITAGWSRCLGQGGFGSVYRGTLKEDGTEVAVKKLEGSSQTTKGFCSEIASLARTNHVNLVKFLGFCAQGPLKRLLVYEFVPNGSLEKWIFEGGDDVGEQSKAGLTWELRFKIAVGTARGLSYLHEECAERVIHLDIKPENVLVDLGFVPKIADFGLSKLMDREVTYLQVATIQGTFGYLAPEYLLVGTITEKSDVFSFGVLLLEIITGCRNKFLNNLHLTEELRVTISSSKSYLAAQVERLQGVACLCLQDDPDLRPSMSMVVKMMEGLVELPELPPLSKLHFFLGHRSKIKQPLFSSSLSNTAFKFSTSASSDGSSLLQNTGRTRLIGSDPLLGKTDNKGKVKTDDWMGM